MTWAPPDPAKRDHRFVQTPRNGRAPWMTCGELIAFLQEFPPTMAVLMADNGWYTTIGSVDGPLLDNGEWTDDETGYVLPTLFPGDTFDCRFHY